MLEHLLSVGRVLGLMAMTMSLSQLLPIVVSVVYQDGTSSIFLFSMVTNFAAGYFLWLITRRHQQEFQPRDGFLVVAIAWSAGAAFATVPLMLGIDGLSFTDAYFETMSGLTTTGATVLVNLDTLPEALNFWRHEMQWLGGMGMIVLAVAILPMLRVGGMQVYKAEIPGPMKDTKLTPRITETAKNLWLVYAGVTVACALCLKLAGMNWLDAICHAFSTLSTGGFSTHDASIGFYDSAAIEAILIFFMIVGALNFATHFLVWRGRAPVLYLKDSEAVSVVLVLLLACLGGAFYLWNAGTYESFWTSLRHVSFNLVSIATDCGLVSVDYDKWPIFVPMLMLFLSCVTASSGSTAGGIKMIRTLVLTRQAMREMLLLLHPNIVNPLKIGGTVIPNRIVLAVLGFIFVYFMTVVLITFALLASGLDFISAITAVIACINNAGPGLNAVGPATNYSALTDFQSWLCILAMFAGRIEVFSLLIIFIPAFWRK